jgi:hypothetical protein
MESTPQWEAARTAKSARLGSENGDRISVATIEQANLAREFYVAEGHQASAPREVGGEFEFDVYDLGVEIVYEDDVPIERNHAIIVTPTTAQHRAYVLSLRAILDATEAVDSYCVDYLTAEGTVDRESLGMERVDHVSRTLAELDGIVSGSDALAQTGDVCADPKLLAFTVRRARQLAAAIRQAIRL